MAGHAVTLQGNLDPARLLSPLPELKKAVTRMLNGFGPGRYIANLGHGILPHVPVDHAKLFVDTVKNHRYTNREKVFSSL
ncbi:MAG: uroporphyrinogen decarboxylase family protein [Puia sp.]